MTEICSFLDQNYMSVQVITCLKPKLEHMTQTPLFYNFQSSFKSYSQWSPCNISRNQKTWSMSLVQMSNLWCGAIPLDVSDTALKANCCNFFFVLFQLVKAIISSWRAAQICPPYHDGILNRLGINHLAADCPAQGNFLLHMNDASHYWTIYT